MTNDQIIEFTESYLNGLFIQGTTAQRMPVMQLLTTARLVKLVEQMDVPNKNQQLSLFVSEKHNGSEHNGSASHPFD